MNNKGHCIQCGKFRELDTYGICEQCTETVPDIFADFDDDE